MICIYKSKCIESNTLNISIKIFVMNDMTKIFLILVVKLSVQGFYKIPHKIVLKVKSFSTLLFSCSTEPN